MVANFSNMQRQVICSAFLLVTNAFGCKPVLTEDDPGKPPGPRATRFDESQGSSGLPSGRQEIELPRTYGGSSVSSIGTSSDARSSELCSRGNPYCQSTGRSAPGTASPDWCNGSDATRQRRRDTDFDGDGTRDEFCAKADGTLEILFADGSTWSGRADWCQGDGVEISFQDINKDGRTDLLCTDTIGHHYVTLANSDGFFDFNGFPQDMWCEYEGARKYPGADFDGDGRLDDFCADQRGVLSWRYRSGRGPARATTQWCTNPSTWIELFDADGDGRTDLICRGNWGQRQLISYARKDGSFSFDY